MDKFDNREIVVTNNSNKSIYSILSKNDNMSDSGYYNNFNNDSTKNITDTFIFTEIKPNKKIENHDRPKSWDSFFEKSIDNKIRVFIISKDSVVKYGWEKVFTNQIYIKKYKMTINDLNNDNWEIVYQ